MPPNVGALLVSQVVKNLPAMQETRVQSLGWEDPLGKEIATHSSILAWRIPWTEERIKAFWMLIPSIITSLNLCLMWLLRSSRHLNPNMVLTWHLILSLIPTLYQVFSVLENDTTLKYIPNPSLWLSLLFPQPNHHLLPWLWGFPNLSHFCHFCSYPLYIFFLAIVSVTILI